MVGANGITGLGIMREGVDLGIMSRAWASVINPDVTSDCRSGDKIWVGWWRSGQ